MTLKKTLLYTGLKGLKSAGVFSLAGGSRRRSGRLLILCYHGLSLNDEHEWQPLLYITPERFRQRLTILRDMNASVLSLKEGLTRLHSGTLPPRSVAITFDDGMYDFLRHGVPIISEFGYPCTLYLTTYYSKYRLPVITLIVDYLLWKSRLAAIELPEYGIEGFTSIRTSPERGQVTAKVLRWMEGKGLNTEEKDGVARQIAKRVGVDYQDLVDRRVLQIASTEEAGEISRAGVDIQLHTHRHRTPRDRDLFFREIRDNRSCISEITGKVPVHFCYPSGHYLPEFLPWLQELGVESATTCEKGLAGRASEDLVLPRVLDDSTLEAIRFESIVSGLLV